MEWGVGKAVDGAAANTWGSFSWRLERNVLVTRENVFKVELSSGMEQLKNAVKHL